MVTLSFGWGPWDHRLQVSVPCDPGAARGVLKSSENILEAIPERCCVSRFGPGGKQDFLNHQSVNCEPVLAAGLFVLLCDGGWNLQGQNLC